MTDTRTCNVPRCKNPAIPSWPMCFTHALEHNDRMTARYQREREWVLSRHVGQLSLVPSTTPEEVA